MCSRTFSAIAGGSDVAHPSAPPTKRSVVEAVVPTARPTGAPPTVPKPTMVSGRSRAAGTTHRRVSDGASVSYPAKSCLRRDPPARQRRCLRKGRAAGATHRRASVGVSEKVPERQAESTSALRAEAEPPAQPKRSEAAGPTLSVGPRLRRSEARWRRRESNPRPKTLLDAYLRVFPIIYCRHIKRQSAVS